jgi:HTH-type transcriptional regulator / antitoxin HigA
VLVISGGQLGGLLILAAKLGVGSAIVAGHHGYATGHWHIGGSLRGKITDADIDELEGMSASRS